MKSGEWSEYLDFAIPLAKSAGAMIRRAMETRAHGYQAPFKQGNPSDLVTETDKAVELFIKEHLTKAYPDHKFIGEESVAAGQSLECTNEPTWIVDPIDGTTNFVHGFPFVAVSIGLVVNRQPVMGVVFNPILDELYCATKGGGAYINGTPLKPSTTPLGDLSQCLIATEAGSDRTPSVLKPKIDTIHAMLRKQTDGGGEAHSIRAMGSAALDMCCVARGSVDLYWEVGCWEWDVAAAMLIVQETGGIVLSGGNDRSTEPASLFGRKFLAIRAADKTSQLQIANQMWDIIPEIEALRP